MKKIITLILTSFCYYGFSQTWQAVTNDGFGNPFNNTTVSSLKIFNGNLYAGAGGPGSTNSAKIFRSSTGDPGTWSEVFSAGSHLSSVTCIATDNNNMYVAGKSTIGGQKIYRTTNGTSYTSYWDVNTNVSHIISFKGTAANDSIFACIYGGFGFGDQIWKSAPNSNDSTNANNSWRKVFDLSPDDRRITSVTVFNNILFIGTGGATAADAKIYKSIDGKNFTVCASANIDFSGGLGNYIAVSSLSYNETKLYAGTKTDQTNTNKTDYWYSNDNGLTWNSLGNIFSGYDEMTSMRNYYNELWFTLASRNGAAGNNVIINRGSMGSITAYNGDFGNQSNRGVNGCTELFKNYIYYGCENTSIGGQLHRADLCNLSVTATSSPSTICQGNPTELKASPSGGTPPNTFSWTIGTDTTYGIVATVVPANSGFITYNLKVIDTIGCVATYTVGVNVTPSTDITVHVNSPNGNVTNGTVAVYTDTSNVTGNYMLDIAHSTTVSSPTGYYTFSGVTASNYWIKAFPDTAVSSGFSDLIPTYYGDKFQWDSINITGIATHGCAQTDTFNINAIKLQNFSNGPGHLRGRIVEGNGFGRTLGEPIPGADIKVGRKPPGGSALIISGTTDNDGWYDFKNIGLNNPGEKYVIYVDIPGYALDSAREIVIDVNNFEHLQLNYSVDSATIWINPGTYSGIEVNNSIVNDIVSIYPNPSKGSTRINYSVHSTSNVSISIYNVMGVRLEELINKKYNAGDYSLNFNYENKYSPGVYFVNLVTGEKTSTIRMVITK